MDDAEDRDLNDMDETEDSGLDAFNIGQRAFATVESEWKSLRIDRRLGRGDRPSQHDADEIAQSVAKGLLRYLSNRPPEDRHSLAGELFRGIFFQRLGPDIKDWDPERLDPMPPGND